MKIIVEYDFPEITKDSSDIDKETALHNLKFDISSRPASLLFPQFNYKWKIGQPEYDIDGI